MFLSVHERGIFSFSFITILIEIKERNNSNRAEDKGARYEEVFG